MNIIKEKVWREIAIKYYKDIKDVKFKCPNCNHIQSINSVLKNNSKLTEQRVRDFVPTNCEGRHTKEKGCDWSLGGLFAIHTLEVLKEDGSKFAVFNFSSKEAMKEVEKNIVEDVNKEKETMLEVGTLWICKKEFEVEPTTLSSAKPRRIKEGEILEYRYPTGVNFRTIDNEYYYSNKGKFLNNCEYYEKILSDVRWKNQVELKEILSKKLFEEGKQ